MNIEEVKFYMKKNKITYDLLSKKSNIPVTTLKEIFRGATKNPRIDTYNAILKALDLKENNSSNEELMINEDEKELIKDYRRFDEFEKARVKAYLDGIKTFKESKKNQFNKGE